MADTQTEIAEKYLKLPAPAEGEAAEVKVRLLEWPGKQVFQHWIGPDPQHLRPYNCPTKKAGCPACAERAAAKLQGKDHRNIHRISRKTFVNALELSENGDPKLRVFAMGPQIVDAIETLTSRKGKEDPTTYDIVVIKRKTGPEAFNISYSALYEDTRPLSQAEKQLTQNLFDLSPDTTVAALDVIQAAIKGQPVSRFVDEATAKKVVSALKKAGLTLNSVNIADEDHIPYGQAMEILKELAPEAE